MNVQWPTFPGTRDINYHPAFKGAFTRWVWRFYTHRFTPSARWFFWSTLFLMGYASSSLDLQDYVPFVYAAGVWIVALVAAMTRPPHVALRAAHAHRICSGETLMLEVEVEALRDMPELMVLPDRLHPSIDPIPATGALVAPLVRGHTGRAHLGLVCRRRGDYTLPGYRVQSDFPLGLLNAYRKYNLESALLVYPDFQPLARINLPVNRRCQPGGVALASVLGDSFEFLGNRDYREGDNIRDIDWKATARLDRPIVREYREEYFMRVAIVLDTHVPRHSRGVRHEDFERAVSLCAAVSDYMSRQEYLVDILAAGPNLYHLTTGRSLAYLDQVLDILACVRENPEEPFEVLEPEIQENLERLSSVICIFLDWNESRREFVQRLARGGTGLKNIVVREGDCTIDPGSEILDPVIHLSARDFEAGLVEL